MRHEVLDESAALESSTVGVYRTAATVKGGRRFSFAALVVVGDRAGSVGVGYAKANQVPPAIEKAQKEARRRMQPYPVQGRTLPHAVTGRFGSSTVRMLPAAPGSGVTAGAAVRAVLDMLGVRDCLTKAYGSTNPKNVIKAVMDGLGQLRSRATVSALRGVELGPTDVEILIEKGAAYTTSAPKAAPPAETPRGTDGRGRKPRGQGPGQRRRRGGGGRGGVPSGGAGPEARP
jgi:small subunit ribosomal protein S5